MNIRKISRITISILFIFLILATGTGCGTTTETKEEPTEEGAVVEPSGIKVALLLGGPLSDASWSANAYKGLMRIERQYGAEVTYSENLELAQIESAFRDYASQGYDLVIGHGFEFGEPAMEVAKDFPDTKFAIFQGAVKADNVASWDMRHDEGACAAGTLAALMTETGIIGDLGGKPYNNVIRGLEAFKQCAKAANPDVKIIEIYTNDGANPSKGKEATLSMIDAGADVVYHMANADGLGMIEAAKEKGIYAIGCYLDQHELAPETVLTSNVQDMPGVVVLMYEEVLNGTFHGEIYMPGMAEGIVYMAPYYEFDDVIPEDVQAKVDEVIADIKDGTEPYEVRYEITDTETWTP